MFEQNNIEKNRKILIKVEHLVKYFPIKNGFLKPKKVVHAVEDVSFDIYKGETLGLVGESGCGKTTLGRAVIRLHEPTSGKIIYDDKVIYDSETHTEVSMKPYREKMQLIFQDPSASLDPRMTVGEIIGEALDIHHKTKNKEEREKKIKDLLNMVGLNTEHANRFPHEFSGGQQQRVGIARALAVDPEFIVCDEPISALDVSIQAQVINMMEDLQKKLGLTYLFIAHDISVVRHISNRIGVMYLGSMVELAESYELCSNPKHPYTISLLAAVPIPDPDVTRAKERMIMTGEIPSPINPPEGCRFHTRCPQACDICRTKMPLLKEVEKGHYVACHFFHKKQYM
jgi:oligopeptide transport system ATP-binding protein